MTDLIWDREAGKESRITSNSIKGEYRKGSVFSFFGVIDNAVSCMRRGCETPKELNRRARVVKHLFLYSIKINSASHFLCSSSLKI